MRTYLQEKKAPSVKHKLDHSVSMTVLSGEAFSKISCSTDIFTHPAILLLMKNKERNIYIFFFIIIIIIYFNNNTFIVSNCMHNYNHP